MSWSTRVWSGSPALWLTTTPNCSLENRPRNWAGPDRSRDFTPLGQSMIWCFEDWMVRFHWPWAQSIAYTTGQKFRIITFFNAFEKSPRLHLFGEKYGKNNNIVKYYNLKYLFFFWIYFKMKCIPVIKAEFPASLLQSSVSHDPSEIILRWWFGAQDFFLEYLFQRTAFIWNRNL